MFNIFKKLTMVMAVIAVSIGMFTYVKANRLDKYAMYAYEDYKAVQRVEELKLDQSTVLVENGRGHGTGFFISKNIIITNYHVVAARNPVTGARDGVLNTVTVQFKDGGQYLAKVVSFNPGVDLAMLSVEGVEGRPLKISLSNAKIGDKVVMYGNGGYSFFSTRSGTAGRYYNFKGGNWNNNQQLLKIFAIGGFSGSAIIDYNTGEVVGVIAGGASDPSMDLGIMVPAVDLMKFINNTHTKLVESNTVEPTNAPAPSYTLHIPLAAIDRSLIDTIVDYCEIKGVTMKIRGDIVTFRGPKKALTAISDYILFKKELK